MKVLAAPFNIAVIVPAEKLPLASLKTTAEAVLALVGAIPLILVTVVAPWVPVTSPIRLPEKLTAFTPVSPAPLPVKLVAVMPPTTCKVLVGVAVPIPTLVPDQMPVPGKPTLPVKVGLAVGASKDAWPVNAAVMVPARKLPLASLKTTAEAVFALVGAIPLILVTVVAA